jgi:hypothetical protein
MDEVLKAGVKVLEFVVIVLELDLKFETQYEIYDFNTSIKLKSYKYHLELKIT